MAGPVDDRDTGLGQFGDERVALPAAGALGPGVLQDVVELAGLGCVAQGRHDLRVVVELDHGGGLVEGEQVGDLADGLGAGDGEVFVDGGLLDPGAADDRGGLHPEQGQLREPVGRLLAGHVGAMDVLDQLRDDALGVARLGQDADGNGAGGSADRDGAGGAPLALEDDQVPLLVAVDGDDLRDAVGLDAGQELLVQPRVDPDVGTDDELGGVDVQDPVRVVGGGLDTGRVAAGVVAGVVAAVGSVGCRHSLRRLGHHGCVAGLGDDAGRLGDRCGGFPGEVGLDGKRLVLVCGFGRRGGLVGCRLVGGVFAVSGQLGLVDGSGHTGLVDVLGETGLVDVLGGTCVDDGHG